MSAASVERESAEAIGVESTAHVFASGRLGPAERLSRRLLAHRRPPARGRTRALRERQERDSPDGCQEATRLQYDRAASVTLDPARCVQSSEYRATASRTVAS